MCVYSRIINREVVDVCVLTHHKQGGGGCVYVCVLMHHKQGGGGCVFTHAS